MDVGFEVTVEDNCYSGESGELEASVLVSVWSNETEIPRHGDGSGHTAPDALFDAGVLLRSERRATEDGRVYLTIAEAEDRSGNLGIACCAVVVPHDLSQPSQDLIWDQGQAAREYCEQYGGPPPTYTEHGISEQIGKRRRPPRHDEDASDNPGKRDRKKSRRKENTSATGTAERRAESEVRAQWDLRSRLSLQPFQKVPIFL